MHEGGCVVCNEGGCVVCNEGGGVVCNEGGVWCVHCAAKVNLV